MKYTKYKQDGIVYIIPKELQQKAREITNDCCFSALSKAARLRGIAKATQVYSVKPGKYCKFHMTEIPTYKHIIEDSGKMVQIVGRDVSCDWAVVTVERGKMICSTAWGYMDEKLSNGMILMED